MNAMSVLVTSSQLITYIQPVTAIPLGAAFSWPACQPNCFAIGAVKPGSRDVVYLDRHEKVALLVPAGATSSSNAIACGAAMLLREAIEKSDYDWSADGETLPDAMMAIFQETGAEVADPAVEGRVFRRLNVAAALKHVF